jgi:hypothetical protein
MSSARCSRILIEWRALAAATICVDVTNVAVGYRHLMPAWVMCPANLA